MNNPKSKYTLLNNYDWLYQKYIIEKLSTTQIKELVGCKQPNSISQSLIRHNIRVRNISEGLRLKHKDNFIFNKEVIEGSLLGDGGLGVYNKKSEISLPRFYKKNKFQDHIFYVASKIFENPIEKVKPFTFEKFNKIFTYYGFRSFTQLELKPLYEKWYPEYNNYKKVIPEDLDPTPIVLLHWFMDDGYSGKRNRPSRQIVITFCSECFEKENQDNFCIKLKEKYNIPFKLIKCNSGTGWRIGLSQSWADPFYEIIGKCPVKNMEYKWK